MGWKSAKSAFSIAAKLGVTTVTLGYIVVTTDLMGAGRRIANGDMTLILAAVAILSLQPVIAALRWKILLASQNTTVKITSVIVWTYISTFFGQILPATVGGDGLRCLLCAKAGYGWRAAVASVALDRVAMLIALVALFTAAAPRLVLLVSSARAATFILLSGCAAGLLILFLASKIPMSWESNRLVRFVRFIGLQWRALVVRPAYGISVLGLCLLAYANIITSLYFCATAFQVHASLADFFVLIPPVLVASTVPISIGGWGPRELAMVGALGLANIPAEVALILSVWLGIASIFISLPGAFLYVTRKDAA